MKSRVFKAGVVSTTLSALSFIVGCGNHAAGDKGAQQKDAKAGQASILETVDLTPGKPLSPEDQAKVSSIGRKILDRVSTAQKDLQDKKIDDAKKELTQATAFLKTLKEILPTVTLIDHIWDTKSKLDYFATTDVQQDIVPILTSTDRIYDVLPEGKAKEHAKKAKDILTKEKQKGAAKAKEQLEARRRGAGLPRSGSVGCVHVKVGPGCSNRSRQGQNQRSQ